MSRAALAIALVGCGTTSATTTDSARGGRSADRDDAIAQRGPVGFELDPGVVVGHDHTVFAMAPLDRIAAVEPTTGEVLWESTAGALPLYAAGDLLLAQAIDERKAGLHLVALDTATGEEVTHCDPIALPGWVRPTIDEGLGYGFSVTADEIDDRLFVSWDANAWYAGGVDPTLERESAAERHASGGVEIVDLSECEAVDREAPDSDDSTTDAPVEGYVSADGELVLVIGDGRDARPSWQIYRVDGDELVAEFPGDAGSPSFFLHGTVLVVASRVEVSGLDSSDGSSIWHYPIRMTTYAGPKPD